jgi:hypothetical protein
MDTNDEFCEYYQDLLGEKYDCVDRLVMNAYFIPAQSTGGFRVWWRSLMGNDDTLDNAHLMRLAGKFSRTGDISLSSFVPIRHSPLK